MDGLVLQQHYDYYVSHEEELVKKYAGMYIVLSDAMEVFAFNDEDVAYDFAVKNFGIGHFLLHRCVEGSLDTVQTVNCNF